MLLNLTSGDSSETAGWLAQDHVATYAQDNSLGMAENCGDLDTRWALNVHEKGVGALY